MSLGNPVRGAIHPNGWWTPGQIEFEVTDGGSFAEHLASGRGPGVDFGNGRCGDPVLASEAGTVQTVQDPNGALIVRIRHSPSLVTGYAHLAVFIVVNGQQVARGEQIGTVGSTGADACHLHWGVNQNGVEVDGWPMLEQNSGGDMTKVTIEKYQAPRQCGIAAGATVDGWNATIMVKRQTFTTASSFMADADVTIEQDPAKPPQGLFRRALNGVFEGLYVPSPQVTLAPPMPPEPRPPDQAALNAAYNDGLAAAQAAVEGVPNR